MRNKILFALVALGLLGGFFSAYVSAIEPTPPPPVFTPAANPFATGVYANGIVETLQEEGHNTNMYPEVTGTVLQIFAKEGQAVAKGDPLLAIEDSVQQATTEQLRAQAEAALAVLEELRAEPRKETLAVAAAQVKLAQANLTTSRSEFEKQLRSYELDPRSVSKLVLDNARNAVGAAQANLDVVTRQYELTKAGAWSYDIRNQERQYDALTKAHRAAEALLEKYTVRAPRDGVVLSVSAAVGSYVSPQGVYDPYTQAYNPVLVMGERGTLAVRAYVDEILIPRLPDPAKLVGRLFVRGTNISVPLQFVRVQPYVGPKIELSNQRTEKVDLRVLPVIFSFTPPPGVSIYPGQLVDVYLAQRSAAAPAPGRPPATARDGQGAPP